MRTARSLTLALLAGALLPAAAQAAPPTVNTGGATQVTQSTVRLNATVNPRGKATTVSFQYGTTRAYGAVTAVVDAGNGTANRPIAIDVAGLAPATTYNYRVVATNPDGVVSGSNRAFKTAKQPLGLALAGQPAIVAVGGATALVGTLSGTDNKNRQVVLQQNAFPFTAGFATVGNPLVTNDQGGFTFPVVSLNSTTQFRVAINGKPEIASPIVTVLAALTVRTSVSSKRVKRGRKVRFFGTITPQRNGARVVIQKLRNGRWSTVSATSARSLSSTRSRYGKSITMTSGGSYRVYVRSNTGDIADNFGSTQRIRTFR